MTTRKRGAPFYLAFGCACLLALPLVLSGYYEKVHRWAAEQALALLEKSDRDRIYAEVYAKINRDRVLAGSWMEDFGAVDGNDRSLRHYYDPVSGQGCAYQPYFPLWIVFEGACVSFRGLRYPGALQWAKDGAGTEDARNWKGAIEAFDYSGDSRAEAYFRLGHVVHLIADMAEPDHATNTIHVASGFYYPKDLNKILAHVRAAAEYVPAFADVKAKLEMAIALNAVVGEKRVGFEEHIERSAEKLYLSPVPVKANKSPSFEWYFQTMGKLSQAAIRDKFSLPIGVRFTPETTEAEQAALDAVHGNYSFFPAIDFNDPADSERYFKLARELLTNAVRLNWGVLEFFHDLVNPPPYVRLVEISQGGRLCYSSAWRDITETVSGRHPNENQAAAGKIAEKAREFGEEEFHHLYRYERVLRRELPDPKVNLPLAPGIAADVRISFGPDPNGFAAVTERMKTVSVRIGGDWAPGKIISGGTAWAGRFTPSLEEGEEERELQIEISGWDAHPHAVIPGRLALPRREALDREGGYRLDGEPESPAKTSGEAPYHVRNYEPGSDFNHKVKVRAEERKAEEPAPLPDLSLDFMTDWSVRTRPEGIRPRHLPVRSEDGKWTFTVELSTRKDLGIRILEREEWWIYPGRSDPPARYMKDVRDGDLFWKFHGRPRSLDSPPPSELTRNRSPDERKYSLAGVFDPEEQEEPAPMRRASVTGGVLYHNKNISGSADPFLYKLVVKGRGLDGRTYRAEFVFDSRDWVPASRDSSGSVKYKKK